MSRYRSRWGSHSLSRAFLELPEENPPFGVGNTRRRLVIPSAAELMVTLLNCGVAGELAVMMGGPVSGYTGAVANAPAGLVRRASTEKPPLALENSSKPL